MTGYESKKKAARDKLAQPEQEPVAWANPNDLQNFDMKVRTNGGPLHTVPLYTTPPQRTWVGLTDEDIEDLFQSAAGADEETHIRFARAIESALRSKNK